MTKNSGNFSKSLGDAHFYFYKHNLKITYILRSMVLSGLLLWFWLVRRLVDDPDGVLVLCPHYGLHKNIGFLRTLRASLAPLPFLCTLRTSGLLL